MQWHKNKDKWKEEKDSKLCLLTSRSASSQSAPVIRAKIASSQSCWKQKTTNLQTSASCCTQRVLCGWVISKGSWYSTCIYFVLCMQQSDYWYCGGSYFGVLVQKQSSFWVPALFNQLLYKRRKQTILVLHAKTDWLSHIANWTPVWLSTCSHAYLPGLWPAELTGRVVVGSAVPHKLRFSNWSFWQMPAGRWLVLHIATATGQPALPAAAPSGAQHRCSSKPEGQGSKVKVKFYVPANVQTNLWPLVLE